jgi:hypothetical protein
VRVGDDVALPEAAYQYGAGVLRLRVTAIGPAQPYSDGVWVAVTGLPLRSDGAVLEPRERTVLVRPSVVGLPAADGVGGNGSRSSTGGPVGRTRHEADQF